MNRRASRRSFLKLAALAGFGALARCGDGGAVELRERARGLGATLDCSDVSELQPAEARTRTDNEYRQHSARDDAYCMNCLNWVPPKDPAACGTCKTVRGPINPDGWCKQWTKSRG